MNFDTSNIDDYCINQITIVKTVVNLVKRDIHVGLETVEGRGHKIRDFYTKKTTNSK